MIKILGYILMTVHTPTGAMYDIKQKDGVSTLYKDAESCYEAKVDAKENLGRFYQLACVPVTTNSNLK